MSNLHDPMRPAPFIYINGYPGVGKLTIAQHLVPHLPHPARLLGNHLLIDPVGALLDRTSPEYQSFRKAVRSSVLSAIACSQDLANTIIVFTDQQSSSAVGSAVAREYEEAAKQRGSVFVSIRLLCDREEHFRRATYESRKGTTKLTDLEILEGIRLEEDVYCFGGRNELTLDVTHLSPEESALEILSFFQTRMCDVDDNVKQPVQNFRDVPHIKHFFIKDLSGMPSGRLVELVCWLASRVRCHGQVAFMDIIDSTGTAQVILEKSSLTSNFEWHSLVGLLPESSLRVYGVIEYNGFHMTQFAEIKAIKITVISPASQSVHPPVRSRNRGLLSNEFNDRLLTSRFIYLRNPMLLAIGEFRSALFHAVRTWFRNHSFVDLSAPLITCSLLYEPSSAISLRNLLKDDEPVYLSQCAGFYLEAAAHAHERVYNLGPSFRNESRTNRHLMEYWHIKAELASGNLDSIIDLVEIFLRDVYDASRQAGLVTTSILGKCFPRPLTLPLPRVTYVEALEYLSTAGKPLRFGQNISGVHEKLLTHHFGSSQHGELPIWVTHKPRALEPFPYSICLDDKRLTMTADLIAPDGFGEVCGVAEKSFSSQELDDRLREAGKEDAKAYEWVRQLRQFGMVPHVAFGMGFERLMRWWLGLDHVKDTIPFPRLFGRKPVP